MERKDNVGIASREGFAAVWGSCMGGMSWRIKAYVAPFVSFSNPIRIDKI